MRSRFAIMLIVAVLFGAGYWYYTVEAVCKVPIFYRIGSIDQSFDITFEEARAAISDAESLWEDATGRNLFTYDEGADLSVNFVFDERQAEANAEQDLRETLEYKEDLSDELQSTYTQLLTEYDSLKEVYEAQTDSYEARLRAHNEEVARWNAEGGAPEDEYQKLITQQEALASEQEALNGIAYQLNQLVNRMNQIGTKGNSLITDYNEIVEEYNTRFGEAHEFTQGDYQGDSINIYQYDSDVELTMVLAHEFGHALSLGHVEGSESVMYHLMEEQAPNTGVTTADVDEFERVCGAERFTLWPF